MNKKTNFFKIFISLLTIFFIAFLIYKMFFVPDAKGININKSNSKTESDVAVVYENVENSVVSISTSGSDIKNGDFEGGGSGVVFQNNPESLIITNNHVVANTDFVKISDREGNSFDAQVVGTDQKSDLAVLKSKSDKNLKPAKFGNSDSVRVGETVLAIGTPISSSYANSVTKGIISAKDRNVEQYDSDGKMINPGFNVLQTDAAINPGNSGGPLINMKSEVIGINSMKILETTSGNSIEGVGFAIPSNEVDKIVKDILANKKTKWPSLGISVVSYKDKDKLNDPSIKNIKNDRNAGVIIVDFSENSSARESGLEKNDVVIKVNNKNVNNADAFKNELNKLEVGDTLKAEIIRNNKVQTIDIKIGEMQ